MREFFFNLFGDLVHKADHSARRTAFFLIRLEAGGALTGLIPIVHSHGKFIVGWVFLRPFFYAVRTDVHHVGIGKAQLGTVFQAFAVHHGKILRMGIKPDIRWHQLGKSVAEIVKHGFSALHLRNGGPGGIQPQLYGKISVHGFPPEQFPYIKSGCFTMRSQRKRNGSNGKYLTVPG